MLQRQLPLPMDAAMSSPESEKSEIRSPTPLGRDFRSPLSPSLFRPEGAHVALRSNLLRASAALQQDDDLLLSRVFLRALASAVSTFLAEVALLRTSVTPASSRSRALSRSPVYGKTGNPTAVMVHDRIEARRARREREQRELHNI